ncbi:MAG: RluA family pseudouridine synthase [Ignavibacteriales bacterium]
MVKIVVSEQYNNKKLDRFILDTFPTLSRNILFKALRQKDIKINGKRINENTVIKAGDIIEVFIDDKLLNENPSAKQVELNIIYEDNNLLIINKQPGLEVESSTEKSLIDFAKEYLENKGEYTKPSLCHRLDRNTRGLVIIAKNDESLKIMLEKIKNREVKKFYQCVVVGCPNPKKAELRHYLFKDSKKSQVYIYDTKKTGCVEIITRYKVIEVYEETSKLEVELITGKTHQIRAHLAHIGHPILGDGKYGINEINKKHKAKHQILWAYKIIFDFNEAGILDYLKGKIFKIE